MQVEGNKYTHLAILSHKFITLPGTIPCFMWEACGGNFIFNSFSSTNLDGLKFCSAEYALDLKRQEQSSCWFRTQMVQEHFEFTYSRSVVCQWNKEGFG